MKLIDNIINMSALERYQKPNDLKGKITERIMLGLLEIPKEKRHYKALMIYEILEQFEKEISEGN